MAVVHTHLVARFPWWAPVYYRWLGLKMLLGMPVDLPDASRFVARHVKLRGETRQ